MSDGFQHRHIGPTDEAIEKMLHVCGVGSIDELLAQSVPEEIYDEVLLKLAPAKSEPEVLARLAELAEKNQVYTSLIGQGYYNSHLPSVIRRNVLENPAWYSAYTPYQAEISQGRLELLLAFQTMVAELTGMDLANASLLDEATAVAESMTLLARVNENSFEKMRFGVDVFAYPQTKGVLKGRAEPLGIELVDIDVDNIPSDCFGVFFQLETSEGKLQDLNSAVAEAHKKGALVSVAADPLALCLVKPPENFVDVMVGTTQRFGVPLGFGGPHAGFIAIKDEYKRALPGRLVGVSKDSNDRLAYRLALQTREQHIRKEKATSNICTAQVLLAIISALYCIYHGAKGLEKIAEAVHSSAFKFQYALSSLDLKGLKIKHEHFFGTLTIETPKKAELICDALRERKINLHQINADEISISFDETTTDELLVDLLEVFANAFNTSDKSGAKENAKNEIDLGNLKSKSNVKNAIPENLKRTTSPLVNPIFTTSWSETDFLRFITKLGKKDLALDHSMIPLGSCTMKLNSSTEMTPISWSGFADIHPFVPPEQASGYLELLDELSSGLIEITGMDAASLQPNAGSQGELAGLLCILKYHQANNEPNRNICLIPTSAHGTNAASAKMAGMEVLILSCDEQGNIDMADLLEKVKTHKDRIATLMVTYPSTHGIFEVGIKKVCEIIHDCGGQVYMDGANLNALIGLAKPGDFGVDVSHLNLHKTFCIPHGGGGPGVGPIVVKKHLEPYLPGHDYFGNDYFEDNYSYKELSAPPISAAPFGSAGILPISWAYIQLMGASGLKRATQVAILSANYLATQLNPHFLILYTGENNRVAHECVLDFRGLRDFVTVEDVAKRLMDYGFHAPTISFPVADTMMVEPTESESLEELDRFVSAMVSIREEIHKIETGEYDLEDNPVKNAPHTAEDISSEKWSHPYSREVAVYPLDYLRESKYWVPVNRIDSVYGDRNLFCSCPVVEMENAVVEIENAVVEIENAVVEIENAVVEMEND